MSESRMSCGPGSLIVEFVGMPGSGKSTLAHITARLLRARGMTVSEPTYVLDHETPGGRRRVRKLRSGARTLLTHRRSAVDFAAAALRSGQPHPGDLMSVTLNWWYLLDVYHRAAVTPGVHVLDQGLLQAVWSLGYAARNAQRVLDEAPTILSRVAAHHVVVSLHVGTDIALDRLRTRSNGASRVDRDMQAGQGGRALERARLMSDGVEQLARRLASTGLLTLVQLDNDESDVVGSKVSALADCLAAALPSGPASVLSPTVRLGPAPRRTRVNQAPGR